MGVIMALDRSSIFPEGSDWTAMSPFFAVQIGIQLALLSFLTKIYVSAVKQAVPLLPCPLALACLLLRLSIEALWAFVRVGSCSVFSVPAVPLMFSICCLSESGSSIKAVPAPSLRRVGVSVACEGYLSDNCSSLRAIDSEVTVFVNSMKPMITELVSEICPSGSWVVSGPGG